jgi:hypothetical protein
MLLLGSPYLLIGKICAHYYQSKERLGISSPDLLVITVLPVMVIRAREDVSLSYSPT